MRRWHERYEEFGYDGLFDRRRSQPSPKRVPLATVEQVLGLYRDRYFDLNVQHFQWGSTDERICRCKMGGNVARSDTAATPDRGIG